MPASVVNIGGPTSKNTWAAVRSPMWKGTGYLGNGVQPGGYGVFKNKNWSRVGRYSLQSDTPFSSGYPEAVSPLLRAFPFLKEIYPRVFALSSSMNLGCDYQLNYSNPYVEIEFFINVGEGEARPQPYPPYDTYEDVHNGYNVYMGYSPGKFGYDINSTRKTFLGATINVTLNPGPDMSPVTLSKTFTQSDVETLFRDNPTWSFDRPGISLGKYNWPEEHSGDWIYPHWTINSFSLA